MTLSANSMEDRPDSTEFAGDAAMFSAYRRTQCVVAAACVFCFFVFWWGGHWTRVPAERGFEASLLQQQNPVLNLGATYLMLIIALAIGTLVAGRHWFFGGLFAASIGLAALSIRGGPMRYVLFHAAERGTQQGVFGALVLEQCLLFVAIAGVWMYFWRRYDSEVLLESPKQEPPAAQQWALAVAAQVIAMGLIVWLLAATDAKKQVLVAVFLGGLGGSAMGDYLAPHPKAAAWYWVGPFAVGVIGYLFAWFAATPATTGAPAGMFANLARPLPLDYASAGSAGALLGYWIGAERRNFTFSFKPRAPRNPDLQPLPIAPGAT